MITLEQLQAGIVLPIDKPRQWTSFQAVNKIKAILRKRVAELQSDKVDSVSQPLSHSVTRPPKIKIGHAGTLDPLATGLLLVCLGKATKSIPQLQDGDKVYTGTLVLGATTPCYDLEQAVDHYYPYEHITRELLEQTVRQFTGTLMQVPPMFSAVKVDGQRAYEIARIKNEELKIKNDGPRAKPITIYNFEITDFRKGDSSSTIVPFTPPSLPLHSPLTPHSLPTSTTIPRAPSPLTCRRPTSASIAARAPTYAPWRATWAWPSTAVPSSAPCAASRWATIPSTTPSPSTRWPII